MPNDINTKMGVTGIAQYKQAMNQATQSVKTLDAQIKLIEKQYQATGDKETYMAQKSKVLQQQMDAQNKVVKEGQNALKAMEKQGIDPASQAYQKMQQNVVNAQAALLDMNIELNTVGTSADKTVQKTDKLASSLNGINKKVSFDAVLGGIGKITDGMEAAARRVEALARDVWSTLTTAASWADNENTLAAMYGIDVETLQRMQGASRTIDTSVEAIIKSRQKLKQNMASDSKEISEAFNELGVSLKEWGPNGILGNPEWVTRNWEDVFWDLGEALTNYTGKVDRDVLAQKLFGRTWMELMPLFKAGREEYQKTMEAQSIVTQENVDKLNALDDALQKLDQEYQTTKHTILSELAPAFTAVGDTVSGLLGRFNEYLQTDEGKEKLGELSQAVTELFSGLSDVDFGQALDSAKGILDDIIGALKWINEHSGDVKTALTTIGGGFLALKAAEVVGTLAQSASALKNLLGGGTAAAGGAAASTVTSAATGATVTSLISKAFSGAEAFVGALTSKLGLGGLAVLTGVPMIDFFNNPGKYLDTGNDAKKKYDELMSLGNKTIYGPAREVSTPVTQQTTGDPKRPKNITGTASAESMQGYVERTVEDIYNDLYKAINDYDPETNIQEKTQFFDNVLKPLAAEAMQAGNVPLEEMDEIAALFRKKFLDSFEDDWEGTTGGILNILQEAIDEKAQGLTVQTEPVFPEDTVGKLQETLNSYDLYLRVTPIMGALSALAAGVSGASGGTSKSYTNTSNVYFGNVNVNNGTDADVLAAQIAASTRQAMAGFGG